MSTLRSALTSRIWLTSAILGVAAATLGVAALIRGLARDHAAMGSSGLVAGALTLALTGIGWKVGKPFQKVGQSAAPRQPMGANRRRLLVCEVTAWLTLIVSLAAMVRAAHAAEIGAPTTAAALALWLIWQTSSLRYAARRAPDDQLEDDTDRLIVVHGYESFDPTVNRSLDLSYHA